MSERPNTNSQYSRRHLARASAFQEKIAEVFTLFNKESMLEMSDLGTSLRALDLAPTQKQLQQLRVELGDAPITHQRFEAIALPILMTNLYHDELVVRESEDVLRQAFEAIDTEKKGYIETDKFIEIMSTMGEPMTEDEIAEMVHAAEDPDTHTIRYEDYIIRLSYM